MRVDRSEGGPAVKCLVCDADMGHHFSKDFDSYGLGRVHYWRCPDCGFSISRTHAEMDQGRWERLNSRYHSVHHGGGFNPDDPRWVPRLRSQAKLLADAAGIGLLDAGGRWLDYACGDGKLSDLLEADGLRLLKYDKYLSRGEGYLRDDEMVPGAFDFVLTTSVFEHFTTRRQFDSVQELVSAGGAMGLHTLVREEIPPDPSWFYLLPVHCAFHTNRSMSILFRQWGFSSSVYNVDARIWLWFKPSALRVEEIVARANRRPEGPRYIFSRGFVDYWK